MEHRHTPLMWSPCTVPQGSVLGLFLIYIDDISTLALSESSKLSMQTTCYSIKSSPWQLQEDIGLIYSWSTANFMSFNVSKCKCMLVSWKWNTLHPPINNNHQLDNIQRYKYLGLLLSSDLSWTPNIESTFTKARKLLGLLLYWWGAPVSNQDSRQLGLLCKIKDHDDLSSFN